MELQVEDFGCCALDDAAGSGHEGPCGYRCSTCGATGTCPDCGGDGGLDDVQRCLPCDGTGRCPEWCDEGWRYDE